MSQPSQEGGGGRIESTLKLTPKEITLEREVWTNGETTIILTVVTMQGRYEIPFPKLKFLEFTVDCLQAMSDAIKAEKKGS